MSDRADICRGLLCKHRILVLQKVDTLVIQGKVQSSPILLFFSFIFLCSSHYGTRPDETVTPSGNDGMESGNDGMESGIEGLTQEWPHSRLLESIWLR